MQPANHKYFLQWKGRESGPFTAEEIKTKLRDNEIGLLHSIRDHSGTAVTVEEFIASEDARQAAEQRKEQERIARMEEERLRAAHEERLARQEEERIRTAREERLAVEESRRMELQQRLGSTVSPPPPPGWPQQVTGGINAPTRTSGLAITALVMGILNLVPFVNFVSWILAIIFGHIALSQIKRDPGLGGRGMAYAGLAITYVLLGGGLIFGILYVANRRF